MDMPDELLTQLWNNMDWKAIEKKLESLQTELTLAAFRQDEREIQNIQKRIVRDIDIKCLAVRHVTKSTSTPGVDGIKWRTSAEQMRAAMSLTSKGYKASPLRQIIIVDKKGKERRPNIPTYFDRAMNVLYAYSLIPVAEAIGDRKSFAFRRGRSTQDAHAYVLEALKGKGAPSLVVCADIKACYAHIHHAWIIRNTPMDKRVLSELLRAGIVFAGELYPTEGQGISEGANLSPYIANIVLDGLQKYIFHGLYGEKEPDDYSNGNMIRFMDDIIVTVRSMDTAERVLGLIGEFLAARGLYLSAEKTRICRIEDGFTFLSRTYVRKNGIIYSFPSDAAVERFIGELRDFISTNRKSQRDLIVSLNRRLKGWAEYHRYCDAENAFRKVDAAVQTALWESAVKKHPNMQLAKVKAKYWYKGPNGRYSYALPDDKSIQVIHLADTVLITQEKVKTNANPFLDKDYTEKRTHEREIQNVSGPYRSIWERQNGQCYYCGRSILSDHPRTVVTRNLSRPPSIQNSAYIHRICALSEIEIIRTDKDISYLRPFDVMCILEEISRRQKHPAKSKAKIGPEWKYFKLKQFFSECTSASITLTFKEIEKISEVKIPETAHKSKQWWYPRKEYNRIAEAWITEGYCLRKINLDKKKVTFHREEDGLTKLKIPDVILNGQIPDNAAYELETYIDYIMKKYGLK